MFLNKFLSQIVYVVPVPYNNSFYPILAQVYIHIKQGWSVIVLGSACMLLLCVFVFIILSQFVYIYLIFVILKLLGFFLFISVTFFLSFDSFITPGKSGLYLLVFLIGIPESLYSFVCIFNIDVFWIWKLGLVLLGEIKIGIESAFITILLVF